MRRITQKATADAAVADMHDMGHRSEPGRVEFDVTWPWDEDDATSHGPEGPQITMRVVADSGDDLAEATLDPRAIDVMREVLHDLDRDYRWEHVADARQHRVAIRFDTAAS